MRTKRHSLEKDNTRARAVKVYVLGLALSITAEQRSRAGGRGERRSEHRERRGDERHPFVTLGRDHG